MKSNEHAVCRGTPCGTTAQLVAKGDVGQVLHALVLVVLPVVLLLLAAEAETEK